MLLARCEFIGRIYGVVWGVDFDLVGGFEEVGVDGSEGHLRVGFGRLEISGAMKSQEPFHRGKCLPDAEAGF